MSDKNYRLVSILGVLAILALAAIAAGCTTQPAATPTPAPAANRTVTDIAGRPVTLPANVTKAAALVGPSYEKILLLGATDRIALRMPMTDAWALKVDPMLKGYPTTASYSDPNIEELLSRGIQVVFFWDYPQPLAKMNEAGIPVVVTQLSTGNPSNAEDFIAFEKREVRLYGDTLGPDAREKADEWCAYLDAKVAYVTSRTANLTDDEKPKVYYVRGPDALTTHGKNSYTQWYVEMAGGNMVSKNTTKEGLQQVTIEQVLAWDPDVVFMGRMNNTSMIMDDPKWANVKAVKEGKVYLNPDGVFYWDYGSEGVLLMEYFAKTLHPDLFQDLDMTEEVKDYYSRFYGYSLTDDEAGRILRHMPPAM